LLGTTNRQDGTKGTRDPDDRRGVLVELTDAGREVLDQAVSANTAREKELLANLTKQERNSLARLLKKLLAGLEPGTGDGVASRHSRQDALDREPVTTRLMS